MRLSNDAEHDACLVSESCSKFAVASVLQAASSAYNCRKNVFAEALTTFLCQARAVASLHTTEALGQ